MSTDSPIASESVNPNNFSGSAVTDPGQGSGEGQSAEATQQAPAVSEGAAAQFTAEQFAALEKQNKELESKLGTQGAELGDYRKFFENVSPILTKLDASPELITAIMEDKLDANLVQAVLDGKVKIEEAQQVAEAHEQVRQEMGEKKYEQADPAAIERAVLEKAGKLATELVDQKFRTIEEERQFEQTVNNFISATPDFAEYADKITIFLNDHPDIDDIEVAYHAVKGQVLAAAQVADSERAVAEASKAAAANVGGNAPAAGTIAGERPLIDDLLAPVSNPNSFL